MNSTVQIVQIWGHDGVREVGRWGLRTKCSVINII